MKNNSIDNAELKPSAQKNKARKSEATSDKAKKHETTHSKTKKNEAQDTVKSSLAGDSAKNAMMDFFRMSLSATEEIGDILKALNLRFCVAESCTGGLLGAAIAQVSGVSSWFEGGFITYSNTAKHEQLGVEQKTLKKYGAVSALTACQMAAGACRSTHAQVGISITGIAGPSGGSDEKPVGTVWIGLMLPKGNEGKSKKEAINLDPIAGKDYSWIVSAQLLSNAYLVRETPVLSLETGKVKAREFHFEGDRVSIQQSAVLMALYFVYEHFSNNI